MRLKSGFIIRNIANEWVAVPVGTRTSEISGLISLSETGKFLWELLNGENTEEDLVIALTDEYDIDAATARADIKSFIDYLTINKLVDNE